MALYAEQSQLAASGLAERAVLLLRAIWPDLEGMDPVLMRERVAAILPDLVGPHHEAAIALAADWYTAARPLTATADFVPVLAEVAKPGRIRSLVGAGLEPIFKSPLSQNFLWAQEMTEGLVEDLVMSGFRETVALSAGADPASKGVSRVLSPGACSWCQQFSNRIYSPGVQFKSHTHCRCTNKPIFIQ